MAGGAEGREHAGYREAGLFKDVWSGIFARTLWSMERRVGICQQCGGNGSVTEETVYRKVTEAWTWGASLGEY